MQLLPSPPPLSSHPGRQPVRGRIQTLGDPVVLKPVAVTQVFMECLLGARGRAGVDSPVME